jgi:small subunit ribosomal protein S17
VVKVDHLVKHPVYKKYIKRRERYKAHDEQNTCAAGDKVLIVETRPLSRDKRWRVREIIEKNVTV